MSAKLLIKVNLLSISLLNNSLHHNLNIPAVFPYWILSSFIWNGAKWKWQISLSTVPLPVHAIPRSHIPTAEFSSPQYVHSKDALPIFRLELNVWVVKLFWYYCHFHIHFKLSPLYVVFDYVAIRVSDSVFMFSKRLENSWCSCVCSFCFGSRTADFQPSWENK